MRNNELAHYGVLGMRWGIRRYQPYSVRGRKSGKGGKEVGEAKKILKKLRDHHERSSAKKAQRIPKKERKKVKALSKEMSKENEQHKKPKNLEEAKAMWAKSATTLFEHRQYYTQEELSAHAKRLELESKLKNMSVKEKAQNRERIDEALKWLKTANDVYETGTKTVSNVEKVVKKRKK